MLVTSRSSYTSLADGRYWKEFPQHISDRFFGLEDEYIQVETLARKLWMASPESLYSKKTNNTESL